MYGSDYEEGDTTCVRCGAAIYFEVGFGPMVCPSCGGNYEYTDEQLRQREVENKKIADAALRGFEKKRAVCELLHSLKAGKSAIEVELLDYAMDRVCMFESENVRLDRPPLYHFTRGK